MARIIRSTPGGTESELSADEKSTCQVSSHKHRPKTRANSFFDRTIRSATLIGYREAASSVGLDPTEMLELAGLGSACDDGYDNRIALDAYLTLLAMSAERAGCPDFGARAAIARGLPDYGLVSLVMREAETVQDAINCYSKYLWLHSDDTFIELEKEDGSHFIRMDMPGSSSREVVQVTQFGVIGLITQLKWLTNGSFRPKLICFSFPRPSSESFTSKLSNCEVAYDQTVSGILLESENLTRSVTTSEPCLRRIALRQLAHVMVESQDQFAVRVSREIRYLLPTGECSLGKIAARFRMDQRTVERHLEREGMTFKSIVQQIREQVTMRMLENNRLTITEIGDLIGFSNVSSFSRWFRESFHRNASDWRRNLHSSTFRGSLEHDL